jgi:hypothetical protein
MLPQVDRKYDNALLKPLPAKVWLWVWNRRDVFYDFRDLRLECTAKCAGVQGSTWGCEMDRCRHGGCRTVFGIITGMALGTSRSAAGCHLFASRGPSRSSLLIGPACGRVERTAVLKNIRGE